MIPNRNTLLPNLQVSKWQQCPLLIDENEIAELFTHLSPFFLVQTSGVIAKGEEIVQIDKFLQGYHEYIQALREGKLPDEKIIRAYFSLIMTNNLQNLYTFTLKPEQQLVKVELPVIQMQSHRLAYSSVDKKFRSMVLGKDNIYWGINFTYPQLFQDVNYKVFTTNDRTMFSNTDLFRMIQSWMRKNTIPTPFIVEKEKINVPVRIGKKCLEWINCHPQLQAKNIQVIANKLDR